MADKKEFLRFPIISHGAEYLVQGHLMRRNILTYKAPPNNEGYDLICISPNPRRMTKQIRVQVKSRYQTDCNRAFPVNEKSLDAFDYLVIAFLNIGYFYHKNPPRYQEINSPEFYTLPSKFIKEHHHKSSTWQMVHTRGLNIEKYKNEKGFEQIARVLQIPYPSRNAEDKKNK